MRLLRALAALLGLAAVLGLGACSVPTRASRPAPAAEPPSVTAPPKGQIAPQDVPDAVPRAEPLSRYGNPPFYDVFGKRYYVLSSSADYVERGVASWYGPGFHEVRTSTGEPYDMYGMTAAHKTLPLPAYVRVTNLQNGRSVVVRVNDRGPFVGNRLIDLSYTAAWKLDMLRNGTAMVEVRAIDPREPHESGAAPLAASSLGVPHAAPSPSGAAGNASSSGTATTAALPQASAAATSGSSQASAATTAARPILFVQAGAFADPANAARLAAHLEGGGYGRIFVRDDVIAGRRMYRVRIGPVSGVPEFDRIVAALERAGVHDAHLAMD